MKQRLLHYNRIGTLVERHDEKGERIPFSIKYACLNGAIVDIEDKCMVCIGVDPRHKRRTIKGIHSNEIRTVYDVLILRINDSKIVI